MKARYLNLCRRFPRYWGTPIRPGDPYKRLLHTLYTIYSRPVEKQDRTHARRWLNDKNPFGKYAGGCPAHHINRCRFFNVAATAREKEGRAGGQEEVSHTALQHLSLPGHTCKAGSLRLRQPPDAGGGNRTHMGLRADDGDCCPLQHMGMPAGFEKRYGSVHILINSRMLYAA